MKNIGLITFILTISFCHFVTATPKEAVMTSEVVHINLHPENKKVKKKKLKLKERFRLWKAKTAFKILRKLTPTQAENDQSRKDRKHGRKSIIYAVIAFLGVLISTIIFSVGSLTSSLGVLVFGSLHLIASLTFGVLSFFKGIKGLKYDEDINTAIVGVTLGSLFLIGAFLFLVALLGGLF